MPACIVRSQTDIMEELGGAGNETNENLDAFQSGAAQVLFAPDRARVGLNLQVARVLVMYSVPWSPKKWSSGSAG